MTREEFNAKVHEQYDEYEKNLLAKTPTELINIAWDIAKMQAIRTYLTECDFDGFLEDLCEDVNNILGTLYDYEFNYDIPMWTDWDNLYDMIWDYINDKEVE